MRLFFERVVLQATVPLLVLLLAVNPMSFDWHQRISGAIALLAIAYFIAHTLYKTGQEPKAPPAAPATTEDQSKHEPSNLDIEKALIDKLKSRKTQYAHILIHFAGTEQRPTAEFLKQVFKDAGWQTDMGPFPMDTYAPLEYRQGVQVSGINSNLVRAVAQFLTDARLKNVKPVVTQTTLKPSDINWEQASAGIIIVVGH